MGFGKLVVVAISRCEVIHRFRLQCLHFPEECDSAGKQTTLPAPPGPWHGRRWPQRSNAQAQANMWPEILNELKQTSVPERSLTCGGVIH